MSLELSINEQDIFWEMYPSAERTAGHHILTVTVWDTLTDSGAHISPHMNVSVEELWSESAAGDIFSP